MNAAAREVLLAAGYSPCAGDLGHWMRGDERLTAPEALSLVAREISALRANTDTKVELWARIQELTEDRARLRMERDELRAAAREEE